MPSATHHHEDPAREPDHDAITLEADTPEEAIGKNAVRCAEIAARATIRPGRTHNEREFANRVENTTHLVQKLLDTAHNPMSEQLYQQSGLQNLVGVFGELLEKIAKQDKSKHQQTGEVFRTVNPFPTPEIIVIDSSAELSSMIDDIFSLDHSRVQLAVDLEGAEFNRHGDISIIQISVEELNKVFLVDVFTLGKVAFEVTGAENPTCTLKTILGSPSIPKLMFDCRTDNDVLLHTAGVRLAGVIDLQLLFLATRSRTNDRKKVSSLSRVVGYAAGLFHDDKKEWLKAKNWGGSAMMIGPQETMELIEEFGIDNFKDVKCSKITEKGNYAYVNQRPIHELVQKYCVADVVMLPAVYEYCVTHRFWNEQWAARVDLEMEWRLGMADQEVFENRPNILQAPPQGWAQVKQVERADAVGKDGDEKRIEEEGIEKKDTVDEVDEEDSTDKKAVEAEDLEASA